LTTLLRSVEDTIGKFAAVGSKFVPSVDDAGVELEYCHKFVQKPEMALLLNY
jgi:hypothetical protein